MANKDINTYAEYNDLYEASIRGSLKQNPSHDAAVEKNMWITMRATTDANIAPYDKRFEDWVTNCCDEPLQICITESIQKFFREFNKDSDFSNDKIYTRSKKDFGEEL